MISPDRRSRAMGFTLITGALLPAMHARSGGRTGNGACLAGLVPGLFGLDAAGLTEGRHRREP